MGFPSLFRQLSMLIGLPAVMLAGIAAAIIVIARDWRVAVVSYAVLSLMLGMLLAQVVPSEWAMIQVVVGGLIALMLALSARQLRWQASSLAAPEMRWPQMASLSSFRFLAVGLAVVAFFVVRGQISLPQVGPLLQDAILWLGMIGLLGLALHEEPLHAGLSLLTFLGAAFLLLFSLIQRRMLVGMVEAGQLLLGLAISYLVLSRGLAQSEVDTDATASDRPT